MPKIVAVLKGTCYNYVAGTTSVLCQSYSDSISYFVKCLILLSVLLVLQQSTWQKCVQYFLKKKKKQPQHVIYYLFV